MTIKIFFTAILASALCLSCSESAIDPTPNSNTEPTLQTKNTYEVNIEATTDNTDNTPAIAKMANMPLKISEENLNGTSVLVPKVNLTKDTISSVVVLYNKQNNTKEVVDAIWRVQKKDNKVLLRLEKLSVYNKLKTGEWYLMAFIGAGKKQGNDLQVQTNTTLNPLTKDDELSTSCPFATSWRRVVLQGNKLNLSNTNKQMIFKPQGVYLVLWIENRMTLNTKISRDIKMESNSFCSTGTYKFNIDRNKINDDADLASNYWESNAATVHRTSEVYRNNNATHYITPIKLNYQASIDDGSDRSNKSDIDSYMHFKERTNSANTKTKRAFIVCLMPVDPAKTSTYGGIENETLFYGKAYVTDPNRTQFTKDVSTYINTSQPNPKTWRPYMEGRYLLGSFAQKLEKGKSYNMVLRVVRPMLPIERLYPYRQGTSMQYITKAEAEKISEGLVYKADYPNLQTKLYRLPKTSEFIPIVNNPKLQLDKNERLGGISPFNAGNEYGLSILFQSKYNYVSINGRQNKFDNWFCSVQRSNVLYGMMYMKPYNDRDRSATTNYRVAVRMTFPNSRATSGVAKIETYYLGPNYNLGVGTAGYYCAHPNFWDQLSPDDIITRSFQIGNYWLNTKLQHAQYEPKYSFKAFNLDGIQDMENPRAPRNCYFLPWLKEPAW